MKWARHKCVYLVLPVVLAIGAIPASANIQVDEDTARIVVLGSSTAEGTGPSDPNNTWVNRYRRWVQGIDGNAQVINLAKSGYTTYRIMPDGFVPPPSRPAVDPTRNVTKALSLNPSAIIVNLPSNDIANGYTVEEQLVNYDLVVAAASDQGVPVWITTSQPRNLSDQGRQGLLLERDSVLARYGHQAIDFWSGLALANGKINPVYDSGDGIHLNDAAHGILFGRVRLAGLVRTRFKLDLLAPTGNTTLAGTTAIVWSPEIKSDPSRVTTVDVSADGGAHWDPLHTSSGADTSYLWDTRLHPDGTHYRLRIVALGDSGLGVVRSLEDFTINNPKNAIPHISVLTPIAGDTVAGELDIHWVAVDADDEPLEIFVELSLGGEIWQVLATSEENDGLLPWNTYGLPNSSRYFVRIECTDGKVVVEKTGGPFTILNKSEAITSGQFDHVSGSGNGSVSARILEPNALTDHVYRLTFDDQASGRTTYDVTDQTTGELVVDDATELDGRTEGPLFDGIRLLIFDYGVAIPDLRTTGWRTGASTLGSLISTGQGATKGVPFPADYTLTVFDEVVDTSSTFLGTAAVPMKFEVHNVTDDHKVEVVFDDQDDNEDISRNDRVFILESDESGGALLTWLIRFTGDSLSIPPVAGDEFRLMTLKPFSRKDIYEFKTAATGLRQTDSAFPDSETMLEQSFPNPARTSARINYRLKTRTEVELKLHDITGREIRTIASGQQGAGPQSFAIDVTGLSSGVYFVRLHTATGFTSGQKLMVLK